MAPLPSSPLRTAPASRRPKYSCRALVDAIETTKGLSLLSTIVLLLAVGRQVGLPQFDRTSYVAYQSIRDALFTVHIRLVFKATSPDDGILLYNAYNTSGFGDFIALSIRDQHVVFQFDTGAGYTPLLLSVLSLRPREGCKVLC